MASLLVASHVCAVDECVGRQRTRRSSFESGSWTKVWDFKVQAICILMVDAEEHRRDGERDEDNQMQWRGRDLYLVKLYRGSSSTKLTMTHVCMYVLYCTNDGRCLHRRTFPTGWCAPIPTA